MKYGNRMKCAVNETQLNERMRYRPKILEFHLVEGDLIGEGLEKLKKVITRVQQLGIKVYLHHPMRSRAGTQHILSENPAIRTYYEESSRILAKVSRDYNIKTVIHCNYAESEWVEPTYENTLRMKKAIERILAYGREVFLWEDSCKGLFSHQNPYLMDEIVRPLSLPLVQDISHSFIALKGDQELLLKSVQDSSQYVQYYHVVDSMGVNHDGLELGKGRIQWESLKPYITLKDFIYEIALQDHEKSGEMVSSAQYFKSI